MMLYNGTKIAYLLKMFSYNNMYIIISVFVHFYIPIMKYILCIFRLGSRYEKHVCKYMHIHVYFIESDTKT